MNDPEQDEDEEQRGHLLTPEINEGVSGVLRFLAHLTSVAGEPVSVDLSTLLAEITISTPNMLVFHAWCAQFGVDESGLTGKSDELGTVAVALVAPAPDRWRVRLYCAMSSGDQS